jgi:hypothetical protein
MNADALQNVEKRANFRNDARHTEDGFRIQGNQKKAPRKE